MKALLVDDEIRGLESLSVLISNYCPDVEIVKLCQSVTDAYTQIALLKPDIVFLDVDMPPLTGFDLLRMYEELPFEVIFVTAFDHYSIDAIKFSALYYLLKPVKIEELRDAVKKAALYLNSSRYRSTAHFIPAVLQNTNDIKRLIINGSSSTDLIEIAHILYIEANNTYSTFYLQNGRKIASTRGIKEYEEMLHNKGFFRIHKSYIVNIGYVVSIDKKNGDMVVMENKVRLPLALRRKEAFLRSL